MQVLFPVCSPGTSKKGGIAGRHFVYDLQPLHSWWLIVYDSLACKIAAVFVLVY